MKTVIMAAGFGSRLWPLSTSERPKQFLPLMQGMSPLEHTYAVMSEVISPNEIYVLGLQGMEGLIGEAIPGMEPSHIITIPERRNTLPNSLWALSQVTDDPKEPVLFKSADQFILNATEFQSSLHAALEQHQSDSAALTILVTKYQKFNSNDGYCVVDHNGIIKSFLEKPTESALEAAAVGSRAYRSPFIFIATRESFLRSLKELSEEWRDTAERILTQGGRARRESFLAMPFIDISSTIFQQSRSLKAIEVAYDFIDIGRFQEVYDLNDKDTDGNVVMGRAILEKSRGNLVINNTDQPLVVIGQENTVIVQTPEGSLVSSFDDAPLVGDIYKTRIHQQ